MAIKREIYSDSFKVEAIKKVDDNNGNVSSTAKQLNLPMQSLAHGYPLGKAGRVEGTEHDNPDIAMYEDQSFKKGP